MESDFRSRVFFVARVVLAIVALCASLFIAPDVFLLVFAGILVSIFLRGLSDALSQFSGIPVGWSLTIVILSIVSILGLTSYFAAPSIAEQFDVLTKKIPESASQLRSQIEGYSWGQILVDEAEPDKLIGSSRRILSGVGGAFSTILGMFANTVIILFVGLYGAIEPDVYRRGFLHLIPKERRARISQVLDELNETLKWWLIGKFFGMAVIGIFTTVGLWLLDIPLALILGLIAALFTFIPNIGPIISAVPALLLGLTMGPQQALYVALLYFGVQVVESYLLTPLVQRKTINLPPGLTLAAQVLLGVAFGGIGVALATPLTAVGLVTTKMLYVEDAIGDQLETKANV